MFVALTESHLNPEILDAEVTLKNYTSFRTDRKNRTHGGVITYIRNDIAPSTKILKSFSNSQVELLVTLSQRLGLMIIKP